jgi:hypothetical protein
MGASPQETSTGQAEGKDSPEHSQLTPVPCSAPGSLIIDARSDLGRQPIDGPDLMARDLLAIHCPAVVHKLCIIRKVPN